SVDLLFPDVGELCGGSQREEDYAKLKNRIEELGMVEKAYQWYLDSRRWGGCVHSGFGLGFDRLMMYITGIDNIRDVQPYPRTYGEMEF
ncbi:MAG TPA: asparagine--tRNA ligase, partial [Firmicutes bacterium]|nr:asparagine--tRNA ligase [Bacillota bacterium]